MNLDLASSLLAAGPWPLGQRGSWGPRCRIRNKDDAGGQLLKVCPDRPGFKTKSPGHPSPRQARVVGHRARQAAGQPTPHRGLCIILRQPVHLPRPHRVLRFNHHQQNHSLPQPGCSGAPCGAGPPVLLHPGKATALLCPHLLPRLPRASPPTPLCPHIPCCQFCSRPFSGVPEACPPHHPVVISCPCRTTAKALSWGSPCTPTPGHSDPLPRPRPQGPTQRH